MLLYGVWLLECSFLEALDMVFFPQCSADMGGQGGLEIIPLEKNWAAYKISNSKSHFHMNVLSNVLIQTALPYINLALV